MSEPDASGSSEDTQTSTVDATEDHALGADTPTAIDQPADETSLEARANADAYWRANVRLLISLIAIWFAASFGCGILFRDVLDQYSLGGYPLGFWFAQQGAVYVFIALIVFYVVQMKRIERKYDLDD